MYHDLIDFSKKTDDELLEAQFQIRQRILHSRDYGQVLMLDQLHLMLEEIDVEFKERERKKQETRSKKDKSAGSGEINLGEIYDGPEDVYDFKF